VAYISLRAHARPLAYPEYGLLKAHSTYVLLHQDVQLLAAFFPLEGYRLYMQPAVAALRPANDACGQAPCRTASDAPRRALQPGDYRRRQVGAAGVRCRLPSHFSLMITTALS
jgi:hypothetical protein